MFNTSFLLTNTLAISWITISYFIVIFYGIGRIIQEKLKFTKAYKSLSIPIGYLTYLIGTMILLNILNFFNFTHEQIYWIEIVKMGILTIFVFGLISDWFPKKSDMTTKNLITVTYLLLTIIMLSYLSFFLNKKYEFMNSWEQFPTPKEYYVDSLWNFYIDIMISISSIAKYDFLLYITNPINILCIVLLLSTIAKFRNEITTYLLIIPSMIVIILLNGLESLQMTPFMTLIIFIITMFYMYSNSVNKNRMYLYFSIIASTQFLIFMKLGLIYSIIFMIPALYMSQKYRNGPIYIMNALLFSLSYQLLLITYHNSIIIFIFTLFFSLLILIPLNTSIWNKESKLIIEIDNTLINSRRNIALIFSSLFILISFSIAISDITMISKNINEIISEITSIYNLNPLKAIIFFSLYLITLILPTITLFFKESYTKFTKYIVAITSLLVNPLTIVIYYSIFNISFDFVNIIIMLLIPSGLITIDIINTYLVPNIKGYNYKI